MDTKMTAREELLAYRRTRRPAYVLLLEQKLVAAEAERDALQTTINELRRYAQLPKFADALTIEEARYHHPYIHRDDVLARLG